ncbi:MAG: 2,3-bisphosphoglycerate-independent phosphoglycerate mutase [Vampirovibrionales bacterium]|nr:2,3-bisphosphoglycerate-independent phosphoglycerate mutase [Vampirovibrionales bacterium]
MMAKQPLTLLILDGWGLRGPDPGNAIHDAHPSYYYSLLENYPHTKLDASGEAVGLPDNQMGNSEVGHMTIGAGRVIYQELTRINKSIREGDFFQNPVLLSAIRHVETTGGTIHLMGLLSDGGVHSHISHLIALLDFCKDNHVQNVRVHAFLDGRDVPPRSALNYVEEIEKNLLAMDYPQIATVSGRYYAMDRDNRWERTQKAYDVMVAPDKEGNYRPFSVDGVKSSYSENVNDEFVLPMVTDITYNGMQDGDAIIFFNFRPDRARQITRAFTENTFDGFERVKTLNNLHFACMTMYDETFNLPVAYPKQKLNRLLSEIISERGLTQFHTAETEKYAHVTFFFNGGFEAPYPGEDRKLIPSPKVATYDLQPEMNLQQLTTGVVDAILSKQYDFIVVNFANPDMVGHTGILPAAVAAVKAIDKAIEAVSEATLHVDGKLLLTADHGNIETMTDSEGNPHTAHTTALVPLVLVSNDKSLKLENSKVHSLANIAPSILDLFHIPKPPEMEADSILVRVPAKTSTESSVISA